MIKDKYKVIPIANQHTHEWLLKKHYAHRLPSICHAYGLYDKSNYLQGVCTFGYPPNYEFNEGKCVFNNFRCAVLELNRLVVNEELPHNTLSFFVSKAIKYIPTSPLCLVSYSDPNKGHRGYIYQATNWIYTGRSTPKEEYTFESGEVYDIRRGINTKGTIIKTTPLEPTHRYLKFLGSKAQVKAMLNDLKMPQLPYPKGNNKRYDTSYIPDTQASML